MSIVTDLQAQITELKAGFNLMAKALDMPEPVSIEDIELLMAQNKALKELAHIEQVRKSNQESLDSLIDQKQFRTIARGSVCTEYDKDIKALELLLF